MVIPHQKKVDGKVIDTKIKKDNSGMPFLTAQGLL